MKAVVVVVLISIAATACAERIVIPGYEQTEEGTEFYVGFYQNRFGSSGEREAIPPTLWVTTKENRRVRFFVSTVAGQFFTGFARREQITYVPLTLNLIVFETNPANPADKFKGIRINTNGNRKIVVYGQHEELASNDAYLALPIITLPEGRLHEYMVASILGAPSSNDLAIDSVALVIGTEDNTRVTVSPTETVFSINGSFFFGLPAISTITINQFEALYLQIRISPGDLTGTRIIANKPISVFSGHECGNVPGPSQPGPCDLHIEAIPPIDMWGNEVVTVPLRTRTGGDLIKVIAAQDSTSVSITRTDFDTGVVTADPSFTLDSGEFMELVISDYSLIQSNRPIGVFQFSRSWQTDNVRFSDPFMLYVPPCEQYRDSYAVATAPFDPSLEGTANPFRGPYVNYTNIAIPAAYFDVNQLTINNAVPSAANFTAIRNADNTIWGYGAQLLFDEGAQVISHSDDQSGFGVTMYGFSNQMSWGYTGGIGLAPVQIPRIEGTDVTVSEDVGNAVVQLVRIGPIVDSVSVNVTTVEGTATAVDDYTTVLRTATFAAGQATTNISIPIRDDIMIEETETFIASLIPNPNVIILRNGSVTIEDDDGPVVEFSQPRYTTTESSGILQYTLVSSVSFTEEYEVRVRYNSNQGRTATGGGVDYDDTQTRVTFPAGVTSVNQTVPITTDTIFEGTEDFTLVLDIPRDARRFRVTAGDQRRAIGEIVDDSLSVEFSDTVYTGSEQSGVVRVTLVLRGGTSTSPISVTVTPSDQSPLSAEGNGVDYTSTPITATFPAGATTTTIDVPVTSDSIAEGIETFDLSFTIPSEFSSSVVPGTITSAVGTITDDPPDFVVSFEQTTYNVTESAGPAQPVLVLSRSSSTPITIQVFTTNGSATGGGVDYDSGIYNVVIPAGETRVPFDCPINNDNIFEGNEDFDLTIDTSSLPAGVTRGSPGSATVTIVDDDPITVRFNQTTYSVDEDDGPAQPVLVLSNPSSTDITVQVRDTENTATRGGVDYNSGIYNVVIPAGRISVPFDILINNDTLSEGNENFNLTIIPNTLPDGVTRDIPYNATVTIVDDETTTVNFSQSTYSVDEDDGPAQPVLVLSNPSSTSITVQVFTTAGSATGGGVDYDSGPYTVTFPAGVTRVPFDIPINNDSILENDEDFTVTINPSSLPADITRGDPGSATVTIVDDDPVTVNFSRTTYNVDEDDGPAQPVLVLSNPSSTDITVQVFTTDGSATGVDYGSGRYTVTFPAGETSVPFDIPINNDNIVEGNEGFTVTIDPSSLPDNVTRGNPGSATVTINDTSVLRVEFSQPDYTGSEQSGVVRVTLVLRGGTSTSPISVTVTPSDQSPLSAEGNRVDYTSAPITATFPAGATTTTIDVPVTRDNIAEQPETFGLSFTIPSSLSDVVTPGTITSAEGTITDDTSTTVSFSQLTYSVDEDDGPAQPVLVLSNPSSTDITVQVRDTGNTATRGGVDYDSGIYNVVIPAGVTSVPFDVPINNDNFNEGNENFDLTIIRNTLPDGFTRGNPDTATVTIRDDEDCIISFNDASVTAEEGGEIMIRLNVNNPASEDLTVQVLVQSQPPQPPLDLTFATNSRVIAQIFVLPDDDICCEEDEISVLSINVSSLPDHCVVGDPDSATVIVEDDDDVCTVSFSQSTYNVDEDDGPARPVLVLNGESATDITVQVRDTENTATRGGVDYDSGIYNVVIPAGQTSVPFDVPINDDDILEGNEDFDLTIIRNTLPDGVTRGNPASATVTIVDDEDCIISFNDASITAEEGGEVMIRLNVNNPASEDLTVQVLVQSQPPQPPIDFTFATNSRVSAQIFVLPDDDICCEEDEISVLSINVSSLPDHCVVGDPDSTTLIVEDDSDVCTVNFSQSTYSVDEDGGPARPVLVLNGMSSTDITVDVIDTEITATRGGVDYDSGPYTVTFTVGETSVPFDIPINNDDVAECNEDFRLTINSPASCVMVVSPDTATVTINDDEDRTVDFVNAPYTVMEGPGVAVNVCLSITPVCDDQPVEVTLRTRPGTATPNDDYNPSPKTVRFEPNQSISCVLINITNDQVFENTEMFELLIDPPDGVNPGRDTTTVTIEDDDIMMQSPMEFNDTVIGDPLYEVPLNQLPNVTDVTSLCYEIHGEAGKIFNLVSDGCVQVNAEYSAMDIPENGNIISKIGVAATDTDGDCIEIEVDVDDCVPVVNGVPYSTTRYNSNGVTARLRSGRNTRAVIDVPNCDDSILGPLVDNLKFWVVCQDIGGQKMIKFQVMRGNNLHPDAHGLIGQFWNIPVTAVPIVTDALGNDTNPYSITVDHPQAPVRSFVADLYHRTWDRSLDPCLYAGNSQGGPISELDDPNDSVIEGEYSDYEVADGIFGRDFKHNRLLTTSCP
ncbi:uncharacterized protein [Dysidea avara]|uniref:uncharacterized protein isoform X5 n=1 Tax=Dysidea avara TaxID=196820 RepID=UPI00331DCED2